MQCKVYTGGLCDTQKSNIVLVDEIDDFAPKDTPEIYKIIRILDLSKILKPFLRFPPGVFTRLQRTKIDIATCFKTVSKLLITICIFCMYR